MSGEKSCLTVSLLASHGSPLHVCIYVFMYGCIWMYYVCIWVCGNEILTVVGFERVIERKRRVVMVVVVVLVVVVV